MTIILDERFAHALKLDARVRKLLTVQESQIASAPVAGQDVQTRAGPASLTCGLSDFRQGTFTTI